MRPNPISPVFDALEHLTSEHLLGEFAPGIHARAVDEEAWLREVGPLAESLLPAAAYNPHLVWSAEQRRRFQELDAAMGAQPFTHRIAFVQNGGVVGGYLGTQQSHGRYYMCLTALQPHVRRLGVYSAFVGRLLEWANAAGFREVTSRHVADNNAVLVPKLRHGFVITTFEVTLNFGLLVHLRRLFDDRANQVHSLRVGSSRDGGKQLRQLGVLSDRDPDGGQHDGQA